MVTPTLSTLQKSSLYTVTKLSGGGFSAKKKAESYVKERDSNTLNKAEYVPEEYTFDDSGNLLSGTVRTTMVEYQKGSRLRQRVVNKSVYATTDSGVLTRKTSELVPTKSGSREKVRFMEEEVLTQDGFERTRAINNLTPTQRGYQEAKAQRVAQQQGAVQPSVQYMDSAAQRYYESRQEPSVLDSFGEGTGGGRPISRADTFSEAARERYQIRGRGFDEVSLIAGGRQAVVSGVGDVIGPVGFIGRTEFVPGWQKDIRNQTKKRLANAPEFRVTMPGATVGSSVKSINEVGPIMAGKSAIAAAFAPQFVDPTNELRKGLNSSSFRQRVKSSLLLGEPATEFYKREGITLNRQGTQKPKDFFGGVTMLGKEVSRNVLEKQYRDMRVSNIKGGAYNALIATGRTTGSLVYEAKTHPYKTAFGLAAWGVGIGAVSKTLSYVRVAPKLASSLVGGGAFLGFAGYKEYKDRGSVLSPLGALGTITEFGTYAVAFKGASMLGKGASSLIGTRSNIRYTTYDAVSTKRYDVSPTSKYGNIVSYKSAPEVRFMSGKGMLEPYSLAKIRSNTGMIGDVSVSYNTRIMGANAAYYGVTDAYTKSIQVRPIMDIGTDISGGRSRLGPLRRSNYYDFQSTFAHELRHTTQSPRLLRMEDMLRIPYKQQPSEFQARIAEAKYRTGIKLSGVDLKQLGMYIDTYGSTITYRKSAPLQFLYPRERLSSGGTRSGSRVTVISGEVKSGLFSKYKVKGLQVGRDFFASVSNKKSTYLLRSSKGGGINVKGLLNQDATGSPAKIASYTLPFSRAPIPKAKYLFGTKSVSRSGIDIGGLEGSTPYFNKRGIRVQGDYRLLGIKDSWSGVYKTSGKMLGRGRSSVTQRDVAGHKRISSYSSSSGVDLKFVPSNIKYVLQPKYKANTKIFGGSGSERTSVSTKYGILETKSTTKFGSTLRYSSSRRAAPLSFFGKTLKGLGRRGASSLVLVTGKKASQVSVIESKIPSLSVGKKIGGTYDFSSFKGVGGQSFGAPISLSKLGGGVNRSSVGAINLFRGGTLSGVPTKQYSYTNYALRGIGSQSTKSPTKNVFVNAGTYSWVYRTPSRTKTYSRTNLRTLSLSLFSGGGRGVGGGTFRIGTPNTPPIVPTNFLGSPRRVVGGKRRKSKKRYRPFSYSPSIEATAFNIKGVAPTKLTGLGLRPIKIRGV